MVGKEINMSRNPIAKYGPKFNKPKVFTDRKKQISKEACRKAGS